jgi:Superinfection immunity protein
MNDTAMVYLALILFFYFIPAIVASTRRHRNKSAIFVLNLFLGWTLLGWVAALVWANTADVEPRIERAPRLSAREQWQQSSANIRQHQPPADLRAWKKLTDRSAEEPR